MQMVEPSSHEEMPGGQAMCTKCSNLQEVFAKRSERAARRRPRTLRIALLLGVLSGVSGILGSRPAEAQTLRSSGRVAAVWSDPQTGSPSLALYLTDAAGKTTRLQVSGPQAEPGRLLRLDGAVIEVTGELRAEGVAGPPVIDVSSLTALSYGEGAVEAFEARGNGPWVTILCRFPDVSTTPHPVSWYEDLDASARPGLADFWDEVSFGQQDVSGSVVVGWYELPKPRSTYLPGGTADLTSLRKDCADLADPDVYFPSFEGVRFAYNADLDGAAYGGSTWQTWDTGEYKLYGVAWMPAWADQLVWAHEMGHGIGMPHSSGPYGSVYDSRWDVMSKGYGSTDGTYGRIALHTIAFHKDRVGWIPPEGKFTTPYDSRTTLRLTRIAEAHRPGEYSMVEIPLPNEEFYTVEARRNWGYDGPPYEAVVLHLVDPDRSTGIPAHVVDPDDDKNPNDDGAAWLPGETFTDVQNGVRVTVLSQTASGFEVEIELGNPGTDPDPPLIALTPTSLSYETTQGTNPSAKSFTVKNDGGGTLEYTVSSNRNWLGLSRTSGSLAGGASQSVSVSVDASGLAVGTQSGTITVGGNGENAPQTVAVTVVVSEQPTEPRIAVGPQQLDFQIKRNTAPGAQKLGLQNAGSRDLTWNAATSQAWLRLGKSTGTLAAGGSDSLTVEVDVGGLQPGTYDAEIEFTGNADNSPQRVAVQLRLTRGGVVKIKKGRLTFAGSTEEQPLAEYVYLENDGDDVAEWSASTSEPWLELESTSGSLAAGASVAVRLRVRVEELAPGHHAGQIEFAGGDDDLPDTLQVELLVAEGPGVRHGQDVAAAHLLGAGTHLASDELEYIDFVGNGDGRFDVGDLRAWMIQKGSLAGASLLADVNGDPNSMEPRTQDGLPADDPGSAGKEDGR